MKKILLSAVVLSALASAAGAQTFGPDAFGYVGNHTSGNSFTSIVGAGGSLVTPADPAAATYDDRFYSVAIPFNFSFYGTTYTTLNVTTNGFLSFGGTTNTTQAFNTEQAVSYTNGSMNSANSLLGNMQVDRSFIAPWWDDMQFTSGRAGGIYAETVTVGSLTELVLEWNNVAFFNAANNGVTFQAVLASDGSIAFNYLDVSNGAGGSNAASATIGIHDLGGNNTNNNFLQFSFNSASVQAGDQITFAVPAPGALALLGVGGLAAARRRRA